MSQSAIMVGPPAERLMSLDEWAAMDEDAPGELVDGRLVGEEMARPSHETVVSWLQHRLTGWAEPRDGQVFGSEAKFAVGTRHGRKADISVFFEIPRLSDDGPIRTPPNVTVEIVSPTPRDGRRDRVEKLHEYAAFGVRWYWLVDPRLRTFEVLKLGLDGHYVNLLSVAGGVVDVPGCEGLTLDIDALWARVDAICGKEPEAGEDG
jgi:Uma2 family endonuclease